MIGEVVDPRRGHDRQLVLGHRFEDALLDQVRGDLAADLWAEELLDHVARHFAGPKAAYFRGLLKSSVSGVEPLLDAVPRDLHLDLDGDRIDLVHLRLHRGAEPPRLGHDGRTTQRGSEATRSACALLPLPCGENAVPSLAS